MRVVKLGCLYLLGSLSEHEAAVLLVVTWSQSLSWSSHSFSSVTYGMDSLPRALGCVHDPSVMRVGFLVCAVHAVPWCLSGRTFSWHPTLGLCEQTCSNELSNVPPTLMERAMLAGWETGGT